MFRRTSPLSRCAAEPRAHDTVIIDNNWSGSPAPGGGTLGTSGSVTDTIFIKNAANTGPKMTAAATPAEQQCGFLFINSRIESDAPAGSVFPGRPWPATREYVDPGHSARYMVLSAAISPAPWQDWTGPPVAWQSVRYAEHNNRGPGAGANANRPQLASARVARQTLFSYLAGQDNWIFNGQF